MKPPRRLVAFGRGLLNSSLGLTKALFFFACEVTLHVANFVGLNDRRAHVVAMVLIFPLLAALGAVFFPFTWALSGFDEAYMRQRIAMTIFWTDIDAEEQGEDE